MKNVLLLVVMVLASAFAMANEINFTNQNGSATITDAGIFSHGVQLASYNGVHAKPGHSLGSVVFSTGVLISGSVLGGGTFSNVGSVFDIFGSSKGVPHGAIFTGSFSSPVVWTLLSHVGQTYNFSLVGALSGTMFNGRSVTGQTTQYLTLFHNQWIVDHKGRVGLGGGGLSTPEPGTLLMLGTGIMAIVGALGRKQLS